MSTAILNTWITNIGDPCTISNVSPVRGYDWKVAVLHCDGRVLNWSEGRYRFHRDDRWTKIPNHVRPEDPKKERGHWYENILTRDGHVEIEVPPGCYVLVASLHNWVQHGKLFGNWVTDHAIVQACCDKDVCATLYAPSVWRCGLPLLDMVLPLLAEHGVVGRDVAARAVEALRPVLEALEPGEFEGQEQAVLHRAFEQMGQEPPKGRGGQNA